MRNSKAISFAAGVALTLVIGGGITYAAIPGPGGVINACYKSSGVLRVIDSDKSCGARETAISWNQTGPQGPPGTGGGITSVDQLDGLPCRVGLPEEGRTSLNFDIATRQLTMTCAPSHTWTLAVTRAGGGEGSVTSAPSGITCPSTCSKTYGGGEHVTLTATETQNSLFTGWSGACTGTATTCTLTMDGDKAVTANFIPAAGLAIQIHGEPSVVGIPNAAYAGGQVFGDPGINCLRPTNGINQTKICNYKLPAGSFIDIGAQGVPATGGLPATEFVRWGPAANPCSAFVNADCSFTLTAPGTFVDVDFDFQS